MTIKGLCPRVILFLIQGFIKIEPVGIHIMNKVHFPFARPVLDIFLSLDGVAHLIMPFIINKPVEIVLFRKTFLDMCAMFENPPDEIVCNAYIERSLRSVGHEINPSTFHEKDIDRERPAEQARGRRISWMQFSLPSYAGLTRVSFSTFGRWPDRVRP